MGKAIAGGAITSNAVNEKNLFLKDYSAEATAAAAAFLNANACDSMTELIDNTNTVIIGV